MDTQDFSVALSFREKLQLQLQKAKEVQQQVQDDIESTKKDINEVSSSLPSSVTQLQPQQSEGAIINYQSLSARLQAMLPSNILKMTDQIFSVKDSESNVKSSTFGNLEFNKKENEEVDDITFKKNKSQSPFTINTEDGNINFPQNHLALKTLTYLPASLIEIKPSCFGDIQEKVLRSSSHEDRSNTVSKLTLLNRIEELRKKREESKLRMETEISESDNDQVEFHIEIETIPAEISLQKEKSVKYFNDSVNRDIYANIDNNQKQLILAKEIFLPMKNFDVTQTKGLERVSRKIPKKPEGTAEVMTPTKQQKLITIDEISSDKSLEDIRSTAEKSDKSRMKFGQKNKGLCLALNSDEEIAMKILKSDVKIDTEISKNTLSAQNIELNFQEVNKNTGFEQNQNSEKVITLTTIREQDHLGMEIEPVDCGQETLGCQQSFISFSQKLVDQEREQEVQRRMIALSSFETLLQKEKNVDNLVNLINTEQYHKTPASQLNLLGSSQIQSVLNLMEGEEMIVEIQAHIKNNLKQDTYSQFYDSQIDMTSKDLVSNKLDKNEYIVVDNQNDAGLKEDDENNKEAVRSALEFLENLVSSQDSYDKDYQAEITEEKKEEQQNNEQNANFYKIDSSISSLTKECSNKGETSRVQQISNVINEGQSLQQNLIQEALKVKEIQQHSVQNIPSETKNDKIQDIFDFQIQSPTLLQENDVTGRFQENRQILINSKNSIEDVYILQPSKMISNSTLNTNMQTLNHEETKVKMEGKSLLISSNGANILLSKMDQFLLTKCISCESTSQSAASSREGNCPEINKKYCMRNINEQKSCAQQNFCHTLEQDLTFSNSNYKSMIKPQHDIVQQQNIQQDVTPMKIDIFNKGQNCNINHHPQVQLPVIESNQESHSQQEEQNHLHQINLQENTKSSQNKCQTRNSKQKIKKSPIEASGLQTQNKINPEKLYRSRSKTKYVSRSRSRSSSHSPLFIRQNSAGQDDVLVHGEMSISSVSNISLFELDENDNQKDNCKTSVDIQNSSLYKMCSKASLQDELQRIAQLLGINNYNINQTMLLESIFNTDQKQQIRSQQLTNVCKLMLNCSGKNIFYQTLALMNNYEGQLGHFIIVVTTQFLQLKQKMNKQVSWACLNSLMKVEVMVQVQNLLMEKKIRLLFIQEEFLIEDKLKFIKGQIKMIIFEDQIDKLEEIISLYSVRQYSLFLTQGFKTKEQIENLCRRLGLSNLDENLNLFGFNFANIHWTFELDKEKSFLNFIRKNNLKRVLFYIDHSKKMDEVVSSFNQKGLRMHAYNLSRVDSIQSLFEKDTFDILCCYNGQFITKGIKQLVQYFIHYHIPRSVLSYLTDLNGFQFYHMQKSTHLDKFSCGFLTELDFLEIRSALISELTEKKIIVAVIRALLGGGQENGYGKKKATVPVMSDDCFFNVVIDETEKQIQEHYEINQDIQDPDEAGTEKDLNDPNLKQISLFKFANEHCIKREHLLKILSYVSSEKVQVMPYQGMLQVINKSQMIHNKVVNYILKSALQSRARVTFSILETAQELQMTSIELNQSLKKLSAEKKVQYEVKEEIAFVIVKKNIEGMLEKLMKEVRFFEEKQINELDTMYLAAKLTCNFSLEQVFKYQKYKGSNIKEEATSQESGTSLKIILEKYLNTAINQQKSQLFCQTEKQKLPFISLKSQREKSNLVKDIQNLLSHILKSKTNHTVFNVNRDITLIDFESQSRFVALILQGIDGKSVNEFKPTLQFKKYFRYEYFDILSIANETLQAHYLSLIQSETSKKIKI